jgi:hypothetical protein
VSQSSSVSAIWSAPSTIAIAIVCIDRLPSFAVDRSRVDDFRHSDQTKCIGRTRSSAST